jgi:WD40 repeat protein
VADGSVARDAKTRLTLHPMRVYVSSTRLDLEPEREAVIKWLVDNGDQPVHSYIADSDTVRNSCLADIDTCDLYVLILCHRYGGRPKDNNPDNLSITHLEFRRAGESNVPRIALLRTTIRNTELSSIYEPADFQAVKAFRDEVQRTVRPALFDDEAALIASLSTAVASEARKIVPRSAEPVRTWRWPAPWDFSAYMLAKRNHFAGRTWLFTEIEQWLSNRSSPQALILRADFGVGKSAFVAELIHRDRQRAQAERRIFAFHFCQHDTHETLRPSTFVRSLAAQLADRLPVYRSRIESSPDLQKHIDRAAEDPGSAFEAAVLNPLVGMDEPPAHAVLVVDAVDESLELDPVEAPRGTLVQLLATRISRFPAWLRLFVTSRHNPAVLDRLKSKFTPKEIDAGDHLNQDDLELYVRQRCALDPIASRLRQAGLSIDAAAQLLRAKSSGRFLYAIRALDDVADGRLGAGELASLPPGMEAFYLESFDRRFTQAGRDYSMTGRLLGVMSAAREPLGPEALADVLHESERDLKRLRTDALSDFVRVRDGRWAFDHFSLREWLTGEDADENPRAGAFAVDREAARNALIDWGLQAFEQLDKPCPDHVVRHLAAYLNEGGRTKRLVELLYDLRWLALKLQRTGPQALLADLALAPSDRGLAQLQSTLDMCSHILSRDPAQLTGQLVGRLRRGLGPALDRLLESCRATTGERLLPLTTSLPAPGRLVRVFQGHTDIVQAVGFSPDGDTVVTGSADGTARVWRKTGEVIAVLEGEAGPINDALFTPDGHLIVTASEHGGARLWNRSGQLVADLRGSCGTIRIACSHDGSLILTTCRDRTARLWETSGRQVAVLEGHSRSVTHGAFSPEGNLIITASNDGTARLWWRDGTEVAVLLGHSAAVTRALFSPDGRIVLTTSGDGTCRLWDTLGKLLCVFHGHSGPITHAEFSADGTTIVTASNDNTARVWRDSGEPLAVLAGHTAWVNHATFDREGRTILTASCDDTARLWSANGRSLGVLRGHTGWVLQSRYSPDGSLILTGSRDCTARLWRSAGDEAQTGEGHDGQITSIAFSPDRQHILTASFDLTARLWRRFGESVQVLRGHRDWVTCAAYAPAGDAIATTSCDSTVRLWRADGEFIAALQGHSASVNHVSFSPDGSRLLTGSNDNTARLWDRDGASLGVLEGHTDLINQVAFSPDGQWMATASNDATARLWRTSDRASIVLGDHTGWVSQAVFSPCGDLVATVSGDGQARMWDVNGNCVAVLEGHEDAVEQIAFSPDGSVLVTASRDGTARVWDTTGRPIAVLAGHSSSTRAEFTPDGRTIVTASEDGAIRLWHRAADRVTLACAIDVDAPVRAVACDENVIVCGDRLGAVHFLQIVTSAS